MRLHLAFKPRGPSHGASVRVLYIKTVCVHNVTQLVWSWVYCFQRAKLKAIGLCGLERLVLSVSGENGTQVWHIIIRHTGGEHHNQTQLQHASMVIGTLVNGSGVLNALPCSGSWKLCCPPRRYWKECTPEIFLFLFRKSQTLGLSEYYLHTHPHKNMVLHLGLCWFVAKPNLSFLHDCMIHHAWYTMIVMLL